MTDRQKWADVGVWLAVWDLSSMPRGWIWRQDGQSKHKGGGQDARVT